MDIESWYDIQYETETPGSGAGLRIIDDGQLSDELAVAVANALKPVAGTMNGMPPGETVRVRALTKSSFGTRAIVAPA